jgi:hypothetical protein
LESVDSVDEVGAFDNLYRRLASTYGETLEAGREREAENLRQRIVRLLNGEIPRAHGRLPFVDLLQDQRYWVRYWASVGVKRHVLEWTDEGVLIRFQVLRALAQFPGTVGDESRLLLDIDALIARIEQDRPPDTPTAEARRAATENSPPIGRLRRRELQVLQLWCQFDGDVLKVAHHLGLHESLVERHLNYACDQFRVESLDELRRVACSAASTAPETAPP